MTRGTNIIIIGCVVIILLAIISLGTLLYKALPVGTGYVAKYVCSGVFISGRPPSVVFKEDVQPVNPLARLINFSINRSDASVTATGFGFFSRTAVYRDGCGCTLVVGVSQTQLQRQKLLPPNFHQTRPQHPQDQPWPLGTTGPVDPARLDIDTPQLHKALDNAFAEPGGEQKRQTRAVVVIYDGQLVAERYAPGIDKDMPLTGWSMAKSVTNALVGILVQKGRFDILHPAPVSEWQNADDPRRRITIDQLLRMSSGLAFEELYAPFYDATTMLYTCPNFAAFAAGKSLDDPPGSQWYYSSGTTNIVARIVRQTVQGDYSYYYAFMYEALFDKIGMYSAVFEPDASGTFVGSSYLWATARDWARFGLLYFQDGVWRGERILPDGWVTYATTFTGGLPKKPYGAHFWLNAGKTDDPDHRRWPDAPADTYAALGFQEQKLIIIPSRKAILVRLGATADRPAWNTNQFIKEVLAALP